MLTTRAFPSKCSYRRSCDQESRDSDSGLAPRGHNSRAQLTSPKNLAARDFIQQRMVKKTSKKKGLRGKRLILTLPTGHPKRQSRASSQTCNKSWFSQRFLSMTCHLITLVVIATLACSGSAERGPPPPAPPAPASFSGVFDHNMVLQRAPSMAALYGSAGNVTGSAKVTVHVSSSDRDVSKTYTSSVDDEGNWKVLLDPAEAGGHYTMSVACTSGCMNKSETTLVNVTFGDVYFCSGQSNMELRLHFTFSRNDTLDAIGAGKYHNIRIRQYPHSPNNDSVYVIPPKSQGALMGRTSGLADCTAGTRHSDGVKHVWIVW